MRYVYSKGWEGTGKEGWDQYFLLSLSGRQRKKQRKRSAIFSRIGDFFPLPTGEGKGEGVWSILRMDIAYSSS
ncbi:TPA: hypothetical protein DCL30_00945 [Candidatus Peribacteria bacterium]|nr:hypothetical protein [Candidatus Peribacteria bacterium]